MTDRVRLDGATKAYRDFTLGPVDLAVERGSVHALLGPNGAGKTTVLELIAGLRTPTSGAVTIDGAPVDPRCASRFRTMGYLPADETTIPLELTASELWDVCAVVHGRPIDAARRLRRRADELARMLSFDPPARPLAEYSHGMRTKARAVAALLHDPALAVLDEPTAGLDPVAGHELGRALQAMAGAGAAVLVATHDLAWADRFADRASLLVAGRVVATGETEAVLGPVGDATMLDHFVAAVVAGQQC